MSSRREREREVHDLVLQKDNAPAYLLTLDSLLLEVEISDETLEVVFSKQMENSVQLEEIMKLYNKGCMKKRIPGRTSTSGERLICTCL